MAPIRKIGAHQGNLGQEGKGPAPECHGGSIEAGQASESTEDKGNKCCILQMCIIFIIGDWNAKVGSQEILEITDKFGLGVQNEAGKG